MDVGYFVSRHYSPRERRGDNHYNYCLLQFIHDIIMVGSRCSVLPLLKALEERGERAIPVNFKLECAEPSKRAGLMNAHNLVII